jgi:hypothetical protein
MSAGANADRRANSFGLFRKPDRGRFAAATLNHDLQRSFDEPADEIRSHCKSNVKKNVYLPTHDSCLRSIDFGRASNS